MSSRVFFPLNDLPLSRHIPLEGVFNFRDIGGYETTDGRRVRWHRVYRSGHLGGLAEADAGILARRRVLTVVDLREREECESDPDRLPPGARTVRCVDDKTEPLKTWYHMLAGATSGVPFMKAFYEDIHGLAVRLRPFFQALLELPGDEALLVHCMAGKDRTGVGIALLLSALGVPRETITADYLLTNKHGLTTLDKNRRHPLLMNLPARVERDLQAASEEYLEAFFQALGREYGCAARFLEQVIGVTPEKTGRLREMLTEPARVPSR